MAFRYGSSIVTSGLVLYLDAANPNSYVSGSTSWRDISKTQTDSSLINGPTYSSTNLGNIVFDGVDDYVQTVPTTFTANADFTVSVYASSSTYNGGTGIIANKPYWSNGQGFAIGNISNPLVVYGYVTTDVSHYPISAGIGPSYGWTNIVLRRSSNVLQFFVNAVAGSSIAISGTVTDSVNYLVVGKYTTNAGWNGRIGSVQVYNRALTQTEITQNYNATRTRFGL